MAQVAMRMMANSGDEFAETCCEGCKKPWRSGQMMNAMQYDDGDSAGWHCDACVAIWVKDGESALLRWRDSDDGVQLPTG